MKMSKDVYNVIDESADNNFIPYFSDKEMAQRHKNVRKEMKERGIDVLLVYGHVGIGSSPGQIHLQYLTRFANVFETFLTVPVEGEPTMFINLDYHCVNARTISYIKDIQDGDAFPNAIQKIKDLGYERGTIGLVGPGGAQFGDITLFTEQRQILDKAFPDAKIVSANQWLQALQLIKSEEEIALLRRAGALTDLAQEEVFQLTRPGVKHKDLQRAMNLTAVRHYGTFPFGHVSSFSMEDPEYYYPTPYSTGKRVRVGDMLMSEFCLGYGNYWGKLWGTWFVGNPTPEYEKMFNVAATVHDNMVSELKPGMKGKDIDNFLKPIYDAGLEQVPSLLIAGWCFMMQPPLAGCAPGNQSTAYAQMYKDFEFKPGHTVTLHIWVRIPNTKKGLWVGSSGVFTQNGYENFNKYPVNEIRVVPI
ncbi:MAG: aminopeptidase P family protein [Promethearchaeota archaeon]|nr:MAG: aminopeptidase P family protein [Candidatus Lokiarchaeota archaeon]